MDRSNCLLSSLIGQWLLVSAVQSVRRTVAYVYTEYQAQYELALRAYSIDFNLNSTLYGLLFFRSRFYYMCFRAVFIHMTSYLSASKG